ncbi:hypothetical protein KAR91_47950 [Candidatus Pacearchaeota archaeon]|nr:hypothetical protein [Candidatus Pacearchaeota archaeon]
MSTNTAYVKQTLSNESRNITDTLILISNLEKERDDAIAFLRSCEEKDLTVIHDSIRDYLAEYDIPF